MSKRIPLSVPGALVCLLAWTALPGCPVRVPTPDPGPQPQPGTLEGVASLPQQVTGVAVSSTNRVFVNFPRWVEAPSPSVAELDASGAMKPFPDADWNAWDGTPGDSAGRHFVCVQSVWVDDRDMLWILDPAAPSFSDIVDGGPKLVQVDLSTNRVVRVYPFDLVTAPHGSYLNDVRLEPTHRYAFLTDSNLGALIVLDLQSGQARRLLKNNPAVLAEDVPVVVEGQPVLTSEGKPPAINSDGIAIDPGGRFVYFRALTARTLYRLPVAAALDATLSPAELAARVETVATSGPADGMEMDRQGNLYLTDPEHNAVLRLAPGGTPQTVVSDPRLLWPDSLAVDPQGRVYVTASQIERMPRFNGKKDRRQPPFHVFRFSLP